MERLRRSLEQGGGKSRAGEDTRQHRETPDKKRSKTAA